MTSATSGVMESWPLPLADTRNREALQPVNGPCYRPLQRGKPFGASRLMSQTADVGLSVCSPFDKIIGGNHGSVPPHLGGPKSEFSKSSERRRAGDKAFLRGAKAFRAESPGKGSDRRKFSNRRAHSNFEDRQGLGIRMMVFGIAEAVHGYAVVLDARRTS